MDGSGDNQYIALFVGKQLIKDEEQIDTLYILELDKDCSDDIHNYEDGKYNVLKTIDMVSLGMTDICKKFYFNVFNSEELILVSKDKVYKFNFVTEIRSTFYDFDNDLQGQPEYFILDEVQQRAIIATDMEGLIIDMQKKTEHNVDTYF
jgi:hypothetical protein